MTAQINKKKIPKGLYCYRMVKGNKILCPYWKGIDSLSHQEDGYCEYLEKSDWDINEEMGDWSVYLYGKAVTISAHELRVSMLWDHCKECDLD